MKTYKEVYIPEYEYQRCYFFFGVDIIKTHLHGKIYTNYKIIPTKKNWDKIESIRSGGLDRLSVYQLVLRNLEVEVLENPTNVQVTDFYLLQFLKVERHFPKVN